MLAEGIAALRERRGFAAGETYMRAKNLTSSIKDEALYRRAMQLVISFYVVGLSADTTLRKCAFCALPLLSCESGDTCDECSIHVFDKLLSSRAWQATATPDRLREMKRRRKVVSDRIQKRFAQALLPGDRT